MRRVFSLQTKLSLILVSAFMATILMIGVTTNHFMNKEFISFVSEKQTTSIQRTIASIMDTYDTSTKTWDERTYHYIAMKSLEEGQMLRIEDSSDNILFDMETHDMPLCIEMMEQIHARMEKFDRRNEGGFVSDVYPLVVDGQTVGKLTIKHYEPYYFSQQEFDYLSTLNRIVVGIGALSLILAAVLGRYLAHMIAKPISKSIDATNKIARGNYEDVSIETSNTKELEELSDSIMMLSKTLEKEEIMRQELTANLAHELRTPLTTLSTYIESMMLGVWEVTPERLEELFDEVNRVSRMVEDLESISKSDDKMLDLHKENVDLEELLFKSIDLLSKEAMNKSIEIQHITTRVNANVDELRMHQVFYNIIQNAIKYSSNNTMISIRLYTDENDAIIEVSDQGYGIASDEIPLVFERLYRSEKSRNRATGGSGIGLSISKAIVEAHSGSISVESDGKTYSKFIVRIPIKKN